MPITQLPGVYYDENVAYELTGEGSKIPVFIGATGNTKVDEVKDTDGNITTKEYKVDGTVIRKFNSWEEVKQSTQSGGIGEYTENTTNELLKVLKEFYDEARLLLNTDIGVPYIYIIDVGNGKDKNAWLEALSTAKTKQDAIVEVYVGAEGITGFTIKDFLESAYGSIKTETHDLNLRNGFTTKKDATDAELIALTNETTGIQKSRIGICEPLLFGKTIARICCTPANTEPGYLEYRSVTVTDGKSAFKSRTKQEMLNLQNAGIIFNRDEHINGEIYPKMNLCVATSFASSTRPADALFHARFNADSLLREIFADCYTQIKANESATNIAYLQTRVNKRVNDKVTAEEMVKYNEKTEQGTKLIVQASDNDPYSVILKGQIQPIKCTTAIEVEATLKL